VERRKKTGQRTARENVQDLCDEGSFIEYGPLVIAAQRRRRSVDDLIRSTPADGLVAGIGSVNAAVFGPEAARCAIMSYDYTVLAGTQGLQNHRKKDRLFELAEQWRLPLVFFTEGGGGRPGDTDGAGVAGLDCMAFHFFGRLSGLVPLVGINSGRCFAGNAALLGCCDVVIATENSNIGMGGPAMIEGGGLGVFRPEEVGPMAVQVPNGVVDVEVADEAEAVDVARRYLAYFQGSIDEWECEDQRLLRSAIPENRLRVYDVRRVVETLADTGSVLELRRGFGHGMVTALVRIEGRPVGIVANNPTHLAGAIDTPAADKATRFMQLCDAFDLPVLFLCDTPGIMVGPEAERTALVRHASRMFVTGASLTVPFFTIVLRKGYGLGAQAMAGGSFKAPIFTVSWPTGEFGGMGLEGAVKLGFRKELAAQEDPAARRALYEEMVARMYEHGKALNMASHFEIDGVIDPADSRRWVLRALGSVPPPGPRTGKKRPCIDTW
jgi:acetyl-CoA carboxylase carboxyltransferase component